MSDGVLLVDIDSTIPNLALMHISTYYKEKGETVGFSVPDPSLVYASCIFDWNKHKVDGLRFMHPNAEIDIGGSGIDYSKKLGVDFDYLMPDYSLYPECDFDLGFTTRGCIRNCPFCIVPKKEGAFRINQHPREFHDPSHKKAVYMDNNILANPEWFFEIADWTINNKIKVDFNQGLDLRLITPEIADKIAECKTFKPWRFAFDNLALKDQVTKGLETLTNAGVGIRHNALVYVYVDGDQDIDNAVERCNILRKIGVMPYPMFNRHAKKTQRMIDLKRWCRPWLFFKITFEDYNRTVGHGKL